MPRNERQDRRKTVTGYRYADFAGKHLDITVVSGGEAMCRCIVHDDSKASMQFNLNTGLWVCFACGEGGNLKRLCRELGISIVADPEPDIQELIKKLDLLRMPSRKAGQPEPLDESHLTRYRFPTDYWTGRGFTDETIAAFDLGFDPMHDLVSIPVRDEHGRLLGVIKRYLDPDAELRYRYPKGFSRSQNLFASWLIEQAATDLVVICEGAVDAMKVWQAGFPAVAQYGSSIGPAQVRLLRRLGVGQVVLFFDNDKAGRKAEACAQGAKFHLRKGRTIKEYDPALDLRRGFLLSKVRYSRSMPSDPGAMCDDQIVSAIDQAVRIS